MKNFYRFSLGLVCGALLVTPSLALTVHLEGLSGNKVVISVNGRPPIVMGIGQTNADGIKVLEIEADGALLFFDGREQKLTLGQGVYATGESGGADGKGGQITLTADSKGHFSTLGTINGVSVNFLVDTGATLIAIGLSDAKRIGLDISKAPSSQVQTASGVVAQYNVVLDYVRVGDIELRNVPAGVVDYNLPIALLGGSFLNRMEMKRNGDTLTLQRRY